MDRGQTNVVFLAAGLGQRLGELTQTIPKCLLPLAGQTTILDHALKEFLAASSVDRICIVSGFAMEALSTWLIQSRQTDLLTGRISLLHNPLYASSNNIVSFAQAVIFLETGGILMNSDVVCHPTILSQTFASISRRPELSFMVVDEGNRHRPEAMKVSVNGLGKITAIGKNLDLATSAGEYIGILYLAPREAVAARELSRTMIHGGRADVYYEDALMEGLSRDQIHLAASFTQGHPWVEIDTPDDYQTAREIFRAFHES